MSSLKLKDIKNWSPEIEQQITNEWKSLEMFNFNEKTKKRIYSIDTPPPYINTPIHIGHAVTYSFMDFFARFKRMTGFEVIFPLGLDRNGLPIEMAAEKKYNTTPFKEGREKFIQLCEQLLKDTSVETEDSFAKLGISFTSYKKSKDIGAVYETDSPEYRKITQSTFIDLFKKGLIYEDSRINNWDPKLQTTVADAEIDYKDLDSQFNDIIWKVKETNEEIIIATTRPELICTCGMVIFNPQDKRYTHLEGKTAISPLFNKEIPIKAHPFAQIDKGSGLVMMCSAGDLTDIQFFREQKIKPVIAINKDGRMNSNAKFLEGLKVKEARQKILDLLKEENLLKKQIPIKHRTPISERSGAEIEFIEMPEFYLKQLEFKKDIEKISKKINFYPKDSKKILDAWIKSVSIDWPISRRRYYATPIPLWHSENKTAVPTSGVYYQPWKESPPLDSQVIENGKIIGKVKDFPKEVWKGEERVLDTWFDSSISELVMLKYKENAETFKKSFPATLRPQGKEIVRTWLYYTLLRGFLETNQACFEDVWIHNHILDEKGRKMSKSLGNSIDPQLLIKEFGAEALRLWSATEGDLSKQDFMCSKEKIRGEVKTLNKLLNITKFIQQFDKPKKQPKLNSLDSLFISYIDNLIFLANEDYQNYNFFHPAVRQRQFLWEHLASHYIELVKNRCYNEQKSFSKEESDSAKYTLYYLLENLSLLMYPIIPQITSLILEELGFKIKDLEFPKGKEDKKAEKIIESIEKFNSEIWKKKKDSNLTLKDSLENIKIPKFLDSYKKDLIACHNLK